MIDYIQIIQKYYSTDTEQYRLLLRHSQQVAEYAMTLLEQRPQIIVDREFVYEASMLHDIGIFKTDARGICCTGEEPYMMHGLIGAELLRMEGLERHALVCERHIGSGLTAEEIREQRLPLPARDFLPITLEEKLVCYADNFFSKSNIDAPRRTVAQLLKSVAKYGSGTLQRFEQMHTIFGE